MIRRRTLQFASSVFAAALGCSCGSNADHPAAASSPGAPVPTVEVARVVSQKLDVTIHLPGELQPYEAVAVYPKVAGFVDSISVDRGSRVKAGETIVQLVAPELAAQRAEAESKLRSVEAQRIEAEAKLASDASTYERLKAASGTPGVVSGNDLEVAQKAVEADRARVGAAQDGAEAARQALRSVTEIVGYLKVIAPFDGVVTERNVHPGALVGPAGAPGVTVPLVRIEKVARLRLIVPVPEAYVSGIAPGAGVKFSVPAFPGETFSGIVARIAHALDVKTRTMPVEVDVANPAGRLAPGMFPDVSWPVRDRQPTLFIPASAVATTTERTFVVLIRDGSVSWVDVKTGATSGKLIQAFGALKEGDTVALRGTDELRPGTLVAPRPARSPSP